MFIEQNSCETKCNNDLIESFYRSGYPRPAVTNRFYYRGLHILPFLLNITVFQTTIRCYIVTISQSTVIDRLKWGHKYYNVIY